MSLVFNYVGTPNSNLICCICRAPFVRPVTTKTCAHTFCYECIVQALEHSPHCPVDRRSVQVESLVDAGAIVKALVDELIVECPHKTEGCETTCQRQMMPVHLKEECLFGEGRNVYGLPEENPEKDRDELEKEQIKCAHASHGCTFTCDLSTSLSEHLFVCPYESLKDYISSNNAKVALLTEHNVVLRHRLETTENTVQTLKKEMSIIKGILGPWCKGSSPDSNPRSNFADEGRSRDVGERHSDVERDRTDASSYFGGHQSVSGGGLFRIPSIAPLDVENTVEGTLVGLRESVVGLAGAIDAVGRRSEMALANETLRLGEEMMSIRAQIHGLRMQVHGILMERNGMAEGLRFGPSNITKL